MERLTVNRALLRDGLPFTLGAVGDDKPRTCLCSSPGTIGAQCSCNISVLPRSYGGQSHSGSLPSSLSVTSDLFWCLCQFVIRVCVLCMIQIPIAALLLNEVSQSQVSVSVCVCRTALSADPVILGAKAGLAQV